MQSCIVNNRVNDIVKNILEKLITYPVILQHTWTGLSGLNGEKNRLPFKGYDGIMALLNQATNFKRTVREEVSEVELRKSIKEFFKRAKFRANR